ncbi:unnamed protein product [Microthlaspi erraticum]|uniref:RBR-type E3 ubiquitin transferase n=1 Tax=Microthlaspi erraticum TaxID=1685480 RepID=A0A6D2K303_9BRAS|nr:unnamed protein product [Microthlaspi erraticum]
MLEENNPSLLLDDVQRILRIFTSNFPVFVAKDKIKYAYKLARETIVSETSIHVDRITRKKTCGICLDEDINADQMFSVDKCRHRFCSECVKRYIEVRLLERSVLRCPHHRCKSKLSFGRCDHLLTAKLREMLEKRIKEDSIAVTERIYCPNPRCSALMSETEMLKSTKKSGVRRCCVQCIEPFCIHCKVPWHDNMSCDDYKRLHSDEPTTDDAKLKALANQKRWRQCGKCQHMIELSKGCVRVRCRCGHGFCYQCGAERCTHGHAFPRPPPPPPRPLPPGFWLHILSGVFGIVILVGTVLFICMQGRLIG